MKEKLVEIYGKEVADKLLTSTQELIDKYKKNIENTNQKLNQKDIILITYGDQLQQQGQSHLQTFLKFYKQHLSNHINAVHFLPFFPYSSDDGFSVIDFKEIDSKLGDWDDVEDIKKESKLMFDAVVNHISSQSEWFKEYLKGKEEYKDFFINLPADTDLHQVVRPRTHPVLTPFKRSSEDVNIWTTFSEDQIDLNFESPDLFLKMVDILLFYISKGASLLRLDAIAFLWKEVGTDCIHHEKTHLFVKLFKEILRTVKEDTYIITETNVPHEENISYFGNGQDEADLVYNFSLPPLLAHAILKGDTTILTKWAQSLKLPTDKVCFFNFTASHDGIGVRPATGILPDEDIQFLADTSKENGGDVSYKKNSDGSQSPYELNCNYLELITNKNETLEVRAQKFLCSQSVLISMPGVPGIYFHSLVGSLNSHTEVEKTGRARSINREKLNYDSLIDELKATSTLRNLVFEGYKEILSIRTNETAFNPYGAFEILDICPQIFCILRRAKDQKDDILTIHNLTSQTIDLKSDFFLKYQFDILSNSTIEGQLKPYGYLWLKSR